MRAIKRTAICLILVWVQLALSGCGSPPIDQQLLRQAFYGSHLKPWDFSLDFLSEAQRDELSRACALVYNELKEYLGEEDALIREIQRSDRDVAMMRVAALQSGQAQSCLWAYEMHFVVNGESMWRETLSFEVIRMNLKDSRVRVQDFNAILNMPYRESEKEQFDQQVQEFLGESELMYFRTVEANFDTYIRASLR